MSTAPSPAVPSPVREKGYTSAVDPKANYWSPPDIFESTPELAWPLCLDIYDAMYRQDAQVASVLRAVISPITRTQWRIDGTGCRPEVTAHVAGDLGLPIVGQGNTVPAIRTRDRFSWQKHLTLALLKLRYGHSVFEQLYRLGDDGRLHLRKLGLRPSRTIAQFNVAQDGGLVSIEQYPPPGGTAGNISLPVNRLVVYVQEQEGSNWMGTSLLRTAYKNWLLKDRLLRVQTLTVERNGMGIPKYKGAPTETDLTEGRQIAADTRAGDNSGVALAHEADLELMGVTGQLPDSMAPIRYHDEQIARAVLAHFLNLGSQTGSWALGSTFADFFTLSLQAVAEEIRDTATSHVVEDLVDVAFGPSEPAPRLVFDEIGSRRDAITLAIAQLVNAGVLRADEDLEQFVRTALGLPAFGESPLLPKPTEVPA